MGSKSKFDGQKAVVATLKLIESSGFAGMSATDLMKWARSQPLFKAGQANSDLVRSRLYKCLRKLSDQKHIYQVRHGHWQALSCQLKATSTNGELPSHSRKMSCSAKSSRPHRLFANDAGSSKVVRPIGLADKIKDLNSASGSEVIRDELSLAAAVVHLISSNQVSLSLSVGDIADLLQRKHCSRWSVPADWGWDRLYDEVETQVDFLVGEKILDLDRFECYYVTISAFADVS